MINKENIKTTDWLIRGMSAKKLAKVKLKAIKQAEKELSRQEKKEGQLCSALDVEKKW